MSDGSPPTGWTDADSRDSQRPDRHQRKRYQSCSDHQGWLPGRMNDHCRARASRAPVGFEYGSEQASPPRRPTTPRYSTASQPPIAAIRSGRHLHRDGLSEPSLGRHISAIPCEIASCIALCTYLSDCLRSSICQKLLRLCHSCRKRGLDRPCGDQAVGLITI
jgi:hypothetical protein